MQLGMILNAKLEVKRGVAAATTKTSVPSWTCDCSTQDTNHIMQVRGACSRSRILSRKVLIKPQAEGSVGKGEVSVKW